MKYNTNLDFATFGAAARQIENGFFDENGIYSPAVGKLISMCVFFNVCVDKSDYDEKFAEGIFDVNDLESLCNDEFVAAYNKAILKEAERADFANAYLAALDSVEVRKSSIIYAINSTAGVVDNIIKAINENITPETLKVINELSNSVEALNGDGMK